MTRKILERCPSCGGVLEITEVRCTNCDTQVRARYRPCDFCALTDEQSTFLRIFVTTRGNLSEVEKRLGISYPTVRAKLDEVIERLGSASPAPPRPETQAASLTPSAPLAPSAPLVGTGGDQAASRRGILELVARGEINAAEGVARLRQAGGGA